MNTIFVPSGEKLVSDFPGIMIDRARFDQALARELGVAWVEEYARSYLSGRPTYAEGDLLAIAAGQAAAEARFLERKGFHRLLLVTGEHPAATQAAYAVGYTELFP